jgi:cytochrome c oxidase assembly protein subunit 15
VVNHYPAFDLSPLAGLMLVAALLALGPVLWVWLRNRHDRSHQRQQALRVLTLFLTVDLVLFGAFTRLSDSGLGCPDWPGCYGQLSPVGAASHISAAQNAQPDGPVTHTKAWIEMLHRYLAMAVGALITWQAALAWRGWWRQRSLPRAVARPRVGPGLATLTLAWVGLQGAFGALTVSLRLYPAIVTLHLLGALVLLMLLVTQVVRGGQAPSQVVSAGMRLGLLGAVLLLLVQVMLGGWVSANYAVLACSDFPTCQGRWWPQMDLRQGFEVWHALGRSGSGGYLDLAGLTAIHFVHRLMALVVFVVLLTLAWRLHRRPAWRGASRLLALLLGMQLATGVSTVVLGWPLLAALLHSGGAAALVMTLTWMFARLDWQTEPVHAAAPGMNRSGANA